MERFIIPPLFSALALIAFGRMEGGVALFACLGGVLLFGLISMGIRFFLEIFR